MKKLVLSLSLLLFVVSCSRHSRVGSRTSGALTSISGIEQVRNDHANMLADHKKVKELFKWFDHQMDLKEDKVKKHERLLATYEKLKNKFHKSQNSSVRLGIKQEMLTIRNEIEKDHEMIMYDHDKFMEEIIDLVEYKRKLTGTLKVD